MPLLFILNTKYKEIVPKIKISRARCEKLVLINCFYQLCENSFKGLILSNIVFREHRPCSNVILQDVCATLDATH